MSLTVDDLRLAHGHVTRGIIGAFYDVYNELGYGFSESVYANAFSIAAANRQLQFEREVPIRVVYCGETVGIFRADFVVERKVVVELKAVERILAGHENQLLNYLRASSLTVGLILNFGPKATKRRMIWTGGRADISDANG